MTLKIGNLGPQLTHHDFISVYLLCLCNYREHNTKTTPLCLICTLTLSSVITQTHFNDPSVFCPVALQILIKIVPKY